MAASQTPICPACGRGADFTQGIDNRTSTCHNGHRFDPDNKVIDLGGPDGGRFWRITSGHVATDKDAHAAAVMARVTGSVGASVNAAVVERAL